jgi:hypothetical protein
LIIAQAIFTFAVRHHKKPATVKVVVLALAPWALGQEQDQSAAQGPKASTTTVIVTGIFDAAQQR